jgi:hypothetical protein
MYKSSLRHMYDPVLSSLKMKGLRLLFTKIIMEDETLCFAYDPETKRKSFEWVGEISPRPKKLKFQKSHIMTMLINFSTLKA